jgi:dihydrofolate synthase/folylpolyglutamate synthase
MLASILQEKGWKVGLYTSPHLKDFRERILINGKKIPKAYVTGFVKQYLKEFEKIGLSFFEMTVGLAFHYFSKSKTDIAVIEVGLGGRLDSTNIITPLVSVITNISFDHMQFLGDTLEKIAIEKAGIIKTNIPVVIGETQKKIRHVFIQKANEAGSDLLFADSLYSLNRNQSSAIGGDHLIVDVFRDKKLFLKDLCSPLSGLYQLKNIVTVMGTVEMLGKTGVSITGKEIKRGIRKVIKNTHLSGRWQIISFSPLTICDTGHNEAGLNEIIPQINSIPYHHLHFIFGVVKDKAIDKMLAILPKKATYYFCNADIPRALNAEELKIQANLVGLKGDSYPSVLEALTTAQKKAGNEDLVFVGGSTFVVAEVL